MSENQEIASVILQQLGGRHFCITVGAKQLVAIDRGLRFRIGRNYSKANIVRITLRGDIVDLHALGVIPSASDAVRVLDDITNDGDVPDDDDNTPEELREGIKYVAENIDEDDLACIKAEANKCWKQHLVPTENLIDCEAITDLLEEYGQENDLDERWWEEYAEIDEVLTRL